jgi:SAM-dependent methyltransferase
MTRTVVHDLEHPVDVAGDSAVGVLPAELLCEAVDVHPGERVLDVATGSGAVSLAAAGRRADVTAIEHAGHVLDALPDVARALGVVVRTRVADAHDLPFVDDTFDVVLSAFGLTSTTSSERVAHELVRVCRPSGRIGLANWAPVSLMGDVLRATHRRPASAATLRASREWGSEDHLRTLFGNRVKHLRVEVRTCTFRHRSPGHLLEWFRTSLGPTKAAFERLDRAGQTRLAADLLAIARTYNRADDGTVVAPTDYVEVVAVVR